MVKVICIFFFIMLERAVFKSAIYVLFTACCFVVARAAAGDSVGTVVSLEGPTIGDIDRSCVNQFLQQAPAQWGEISRSLSNFEVDVAYSSHHDYSDASNDPKKSRIEFIYCSGASGKLAIEPDKISGLNDRYAFTVCKGKEWYVQRCQAAAVTGAAISVGNVGLGDDALHSFQSIWSISISDILASPNWKLVGAGFFEGPGGEGRSARIRYEYVGVSAKDNPMWQRGAIYWAELLPDKRWIVNQSGIEGLRDGAVELRIQNSNTYQTWFGGDIFPAESVLQYEEVAKGRVTEEHVERFGVPRPLARTNEQFFLPFYGISESAVWQLGAESSVGRRALIAITGLMCLVLAVLLIWRHYVRVHRNVT